MTPVFLYGVHATVKVTRILPASTVHSTNINLTL